MTSSLLAFGLAQLICVLPAAGGSPLSAPIGPNIIAGEAAAPQRGVYEIALASDAVIVNPWLDCMLSATFTRPDSTSVRAEGFYDGISNGKHVFKVRAYCDQPGQWHWTFASSLPDLEGRAGTFVVVPSPLPGKLRKHAEDSRQFAYDNGEWFLHIGDTGYRYVVDTEPEWQAYIDQAVQMGATKIRTWFCRSRSGVEALFTADRTALNLAYWQEIDRRMQYALNKYPGVIFQLIPYGEDTQELLRLGQGDRMSHLVAQYAQARLSAFPNVIWCVSNDHRIVADGAQPKNGCVQASVIAGVAGEMAAREPWGTLMTNHQARGTGYAFTSAAWSDIITLEDMDQVSGQILREYREKADDPVINDEDRYELYRPPAHPGYFFRRLMWASLLSGGAATYGGACTYKPYNGRDCGVRGYYDLKREKILNDGADSFVHIHSFFRQTGLALAGMRPADAMAGGDPHSSKVIASDRAVIVYLPNPDSETPGEADAAKTKPACLLQLPQGKWSLRWFNPATGEWFDDREPGTMKEVSPRKCTAPFEGDAVLYAVLE